MGEDLGLRQDVIDDVIAEIGLLSSVQAVHPLLEDRAAATERLADAFRIEVVEAANLPVTPDAEELLREEPRRHPGPLRLGANRENERSPLLPRERIRPPDS